MSLVDIFMTVLGGAMVAYGLIAARYFWITRPPVVFDERYGRWRAQRGLHQQIGRDHRHAGLIRPGNAPVDR